MDIQNPNFFRFMSFFLRNNIEKKSFIKAFFQCFSLKNVFFQIQYDYIVLNVGDEIPRTKYNTNVNLLKIGLGYQFN